MDIQQLISQLSEKQSELTKRIEAINGDFQKGRSADFAEQTTESENDEVLQVIKVEATSELRLVKDALARAKQGEFGLCTHCGEEIAEARLHTLPYTDYCINCAD